MSWFTGATPAESAAISARGPGPGARSHVRRWRAENQLDLAEVIRRKRAAGY